MIFKTRHTREWDIEPFWQGLSVVSLEASMFRLQKHPAGGETLVHLLVRALNSWVYFWPNPKEEAPPRVKHHLGRETTPTKGPS